MIEVKNLTKLYGKFKAVDDVSLCAADGEVTILLGPNGAGKSTTIKSITNLLQYKGDIKINGVANSSLDAKKGFGYIPEAPVLYDLLTVDEHVEFIGKAYRCENYRALADEYIALFKLEDKRKKAVRELSKGMKQKVSMLLALIISPKTLLVDEPMVGLDPASIEETLQLFVRLKQQGVAILISTHIIDVIEAIWDSAYIMDHGRIVAHVRKEELKDKSIKEIFFASVEGDEHEHTEYHGCQYGDHDRCRIYGADGRRHAAAEKKGAVYGGGCLLSVQRTLYPCTDHALSHAAEYRFRLSVRGSFPAYGHSAGKHD